MNPASKILKRAALRSSPNKVLKQLTSLTKHYPQFKKKSSIYKKYLRTHFGDFPTNCRVKDHKTDCMVDRKILERTTGRKNHSNCTPLNDNKTARCTVPTEQFKAAVRKAAQETAQSVQFEKTQKITDMQQIRDVGKRLANFIICSDQKELMKGPDRTITALKNDLRRSYMTVNGILLPIFTELPIKKIKNEKKEDLEVSEEYVQDKYYLPIEKVNTTGTRWINKALKKNPYLSDPTFWIADWTYLNILLEKEKKTFLLRKFRNLTGHEAGMIKQNPSGRGWVPENNPKKIIKCRRAK